MPLELKREQQLILERAAQAGMSPEDVLDQAFDVIRDQYETANWMPAARERIAAQIEEGFLQAERGELISGAEVVRILEERHIRPKA